MSVREIANMKCADRAWGGRREGEVEGQFSTDGTCFFYMWVPLVGTSGGLALGAQTLSPHARAPASESRANGAQPLFIAGVPGL